MNHDSHDRSSLLHLQLTSKKLHALVTPLIYNAISITFSDSDAFIKWATTLRMTTFGQSFVSAVHLVIKLIGIDTAAWKPQAPFTSFPHISIPFHRLPKLHATFASNPTLATYTNSLILNPFSGKVRLVDGWRDVVEKGWDELRGILPFFTTVSRLSVCYNLSFRPEILRSLPNPSQLTRLEILFAESIRAVLELLRLHPNLQYVHIPLSKSLSIPNDLTGVVELPRLFSLEAGSTLWKALPQVLSHSSMSTIRHLDVDDISAIPRPGPLMNNLISFQILSKDPSLFAQLSHHLLNVEFISIQGAETEASSTTPPKLTINVFTLPPTSTMPTSTPF
ncbi:hypothetical protein ONZ45_g13652 [Pleurotus djamor]|nr:hypothetical protein ONZ45_g13652 [Pleurotus djamor]